MPGFDEGKSWRVPTFAIGVKLARKLLIIMGVGKENLLLLFLRIIKNNRRDVLIEKFLQGKKFLDKHLQVRQMLIGFPNKMPFDQGMKSKLNI